MIELMNHFSSVRANITLQPEATRGITEHIEAIFLNSVRYQILSSARRDLIGHVVRSKVLRRIDAALESEELFSR